MAKFKVSDKGNLITITHKQFKKFEISQRELDAFEEHLIPGFFRPKVIKPNHIDYVAPSAMSLTKYMTEGFSVHKLYSILAQIVEITKRVEMYHLYLQNLVLNTAVIYVKQITGELFFLYEPLTNSDNSANVYTFVIDLVSSIKSDSRDITYEQERILAYLKDQKHYRVDDIEAMISAFYPQIYQQITRLSSGNSGFINSSRLSYEQQQAAEKPATAQQQSKYKSQSLNPVPSVNLASQPVPSEPYYPPSRGFTPQSTNFDDDGTTLLMEDEGTTLLTEDEGTTLLTNYGPKGRLTRLRTGEEIIISGSYFLLGKGQDTDYLITNNSAISRHHVSFKIVGEDFFIVDENSKNHTWVNGKLLTPGVDEPINDNTQIRMADEEFVFTLE